MPAVAITDHGNMFGAFKFVAEASAKGVKPIVGCEFYLVSDRHRKEFTKDQKDQRYHQLLLAKDQEGYKNLARLCSLGYLEGLYSKYPRIDKELIIKYKDGLIATTCCIGAEVPQLILNKGEAEAEEAFRWWLDLFGEDYYVELQRHNMEEQEIVNATLLKFAKKYGVKIIASNDSHYIDQKDAMPHDILLCVNTNELIDTPKGDNKGERFGFPNDQFFFKTTAEMSTLFADLPQAIDNTNEIVDKIAPVKLKRDILLPNYPLPSEFSDLDDYLKHLTFKGAEKRYGEISQDITERLEFELRVIRQMGFAGYFLIVQDFINAGRDLGVLVGPGRGSAAGSAVAYCIGITNIDPVKYDLLFERFLNPERMSMPDIDVDFDDEGRAKVINYVVDKYGKEKVAQIVTIGTMASKSAIKDTARVYNLPIPDANMLTKLVDVVDEKATADEKKKFSIKKVCFNYPEFQDILNKNNRHAEVLKMAAEVEGSIRNTGIHAAGVIIAPSDLMDLIPLCTAKDAEMQITQFDGSVIEKAGMLKMDFLGLITLTIIKNALILIEENHGNLIDIDKIPLDDAKTFELYQNGDTIGTFQFESTGMRKYLKDLKPTNIDDLIAMNALFRPGPLAFIPTYIKRKHGLEPVEYPHPLLEGLLKPTYGIMVYQEQIMQTAQIMAGYSLGGADLLRRAMGKKDAKEMERQRGIFYEGCKNTHGLSEKEAKPIFDTMEKFAEYGFNKSHSAAYSVVAYQTAWLKANYPAEYMAALLTSNIGKIEKLTEFIEEARRMGIDVLGPDVNESGLKFAVTRQGKIRIGLGGIKGNGEGAALEIIQQRQNAGAYQDLFDFLSRINLRTVNKKSIESLIYSGALDEFGYDRAQYFHKPDDTTMLDKLLRYAATLQSNKENSMMSLFGAGAASTLAPPKMPDCEPMLFLERLNKEKEMIGLYLTGHPLDPYKLQMEALSTVTIGELDPDKITASEFSFSAKVQNRFQKTTKNGDPYLTVLVADFDGTLSVSLFKKDFAAFQNLLQEGMMVLITAAYELWPGRAQKELKIRRVQMLDEAFDKKIKSIDLHMSPMELKTMEADFIKKLAQENPGTKPLRIILEDAQLQVAQTFSTGFRVNISDSFVKSLQPYGRINMPQNRVS